MRVSILWFFQKIDAVISCYFFETGVYNINYTEILLIYKSHVWLWLCCSAVRKSTGCPTPQNVLRKNVSLYTLCLGIANVLQALLNVNLILCGRFVLIFNYNKYVYKKKNGNKQCTIYNIVRCRIIVRFFYNKILVNK